MRQFLTDNAKQFWALMRESIITQAVITLILIGVASYLALVGRPIPELISTWGGVAIGFFFGSKFSQQRKE